MAIKLECAPCGGAARELALRIARRGIDSSFVAQLGPEAPDLFTGFVNGPPSSSKNKIQERAVSCGTDCQVLVRGVQPGVLCAVAV